MVESEETQQTEVQKVLAQSAELKRNYKLLKKAFKEERDHRSNIENELMIKIKQVNDQAIMVEELKDRNLELFEEKMGLEEQSAGLRHVNKLRDNTNNKDDEHIKEMLQTQNLLREEMKEKEFFRDQAQTVMQQLMVIQDKDKSKEKELESAAQRCKLEVQLLEEKNAAMH